MITETTDRPQRPRAPAHRRTALASTLSAGIAAVWLRGDPQETSHEPPRQFSPGLSRAGRRHPLPGLYCLKRHPIPIQAHFRHCLVLTYAVDPHAVAPLVPPGMMLDLFEDRAMLAVALVQTEALRPRGWPRWTGRDFFLAGYRVFVKYRTPERRTLRGLRILRSDTDRLLMVAGGNLLTHYQYRRCDARVVATGDRLDIRVRTPHRQADLHVRANLAGDGALPAGSPFATWQQARRFAGPLPYTFDYEPQTHSVILIKATRSRWQPRPVSVEVTENTFLDTEPFADANPVLVCAFHVGDVPYGWERGVRHVLPEQPR